MCIKFYKDRDNRRGNHNLALFQKSKKDNETKNENKYVKINPRGKLQISKIGET